MIANYIAVDGKTIEKYKGKSNDFIASQLVTLEDEAPLFCDIDKMWDAMHYLLTGESMESGEEKEEILSQAVLGVSTFSNEPTQIILSYILPSMIPEIYEALETFDIETRLSEISAEELQEKEVYPEIWFDEETEIFQEELQDIFQEMKQFYQNLLEQELGVLVSIF